MFLSSLKNTVSSRLGIKSVLAVILLISIISCVLSSFFIMRQKTLLTRELKSRIQSLGQNLVYDSRSYLLRNNFPDNKLIHGVNSEKDILDTSITFSDGVIKQTTIHQIEVNVNQDDFEKSINGDIILDDTASQNNNIRLYGICCF